MVLGLRHCSTDGGTPAGRSEVYARVVDFAGRFKQRNGSLTCRDLLGCDISTAEGLKQAKEQNLFKTTCLQMVKDAEGATKFLTFTVKGASSEAEARMAAKAVVSSLLIKCSLAGKDQRGGVSLAARGSVGQGSLEV